MKLCPNKPAESGLFRLFSTVFLASSMDFVFFVITISALPRSAILSRSGQQLGPRSGVHQQGFLSYGPVVILVLVLQSPQCRSFSTINFLDAYWQRELPSTNTGSGITAFLGVFALLCRNQGCFFSSSSQESRLLSKELFWQPHSNASLP